MDRRPLTRYERNVVLAALLEVGVASRSVCRAAVGHCQIIPRIPTVLEIRGPATAVAYLALRFRASGVTLGDDVYIRTEHFGDGHGVPLDLLAHEVAHVTQFRRDGTLSFLTRYLYHYSRGLARGLSDRRAYRAISYEREARRVAEAVDQSVSSSECSRPSAATPPSARAFEDTSSANVR